MTDVLEIFAPYGPGSLFGALLVLVVLYFGKQFLEEFKAQNERKANIDLKREERKQAEVDERALHELYLRPFEIAVKEGAPSTVMCSYNRLNGAYASENKPLLTDILRGAWGFDGFVMSDWGAVNDRVKGIAAGLELEMPGSQGVNDRRLIDAVRSGALQIVLKDYVAPATPVSVVYLPGRQNTPRVRWFHRLPQAAAEAARQSTPLCSKNRLSSLSTSAWRNAGDTSANGTHWPRRTVASVRRRCSTSPSCERIRVLEG